VGGKAVQVAPADGYTLLFSGATHVLAKQVMAKAPYDPVTDFAPVARVGEAPLLLVISPNLPEQKLGEVVQSARQNPDNWTAALPAMGAPSHLAGEMFKSATGTRRNTTSESATTSTAGGRSSTADEASSQQGPSSTPNWCSMASPAITPSTTRPDSRKQTQGSAWFRCNRVWPRGAASLAAVTGAV
jgi:tripartite-type tricarboxylate transporter receptor subunit TctC